MREAESNLDSFWSRWDTCLETRGMVTEQVLSDFLDTRPVQRTPPWIPPEERGMPKPTNSDDVDQRLNLLELESRTEKTISTEDTRAPKDKPKTRGVVEPFKAADQTPGADFPALETISKFVVGKRAYKVFSSLFYNVEENNAVPVDWKDFLAAMSALDFKIEKLYGSVWQFTPTRLDSEESLQIHEPHPVAKLTPWMARRIGRRLHRHYGWTSATFSRA